MPDEIAELLKQVRGQNPVKNPFSEKISRHAKDAGLDEDLVHRLSGQESEFDPKAKSWTGHTGLMQTSDDIVKRFVKPEEFGTLDRNNPDVSLAAGTRYYKWLLDRYKGDTKRALAGYNAGEGNADKEDWWEKSQYWSNDPDVQAGRKPRGITDKTNTRNYIEKITKGYAGKGYAISDVDKALEQARQPSDSEIDNLLTQIRSPQTESTYKGSIDDLIKNKAPLAKFTYGENPTAPATISNNTKVADGSIKPEKGEKSPISFKADDGRIFVEQSDQSGLKPNQVRIRDISNDKGGVLVVDRVKSADGKESFRIPATAVSPARSIGVKSINNKNIKSGPASVIQNKIKLSDGAELVKAADQNNLNQGEIRFEGNGETYIVNKDSGDVRDESLSQMQEQIPLNLIPEEQRTQLSPKAAQAVLSGQIAKVLTSKYNGAVSVENPNGISLSPSDVAAYYDINGIIDWDTKQNIDPARFYASGDQKTDTFYLTRRDVKNVINFAEKRRALLEDEALKLIASGRELTPREIQSLKNQDISIEELEQKRYADVQMARTKGEIAKKDFQRFLGEETARNAPYIANLKARARVGWLPREVVQNEIELYEQTRKQQIDENIKRQEWASRTNSDPLQMPTGQIPEFSPNTVAAEREADAYLKRLTDTFGSITEQKRREREKELAEAARQNKVAQMSWGEYLGKSALSFPANITKSAISTAISGTWRGIALAANEIEDLIDPANKKSVDQYGSYQIAENADKFLNKYLTVDEALEGEFLTGDLSQGIGSSIGMMFGGAAKTPKLAIGLLSSLQMGGDGYREAKQFGATEEQAQMAGLLQAPLGLTEILGMGKAVERLNAGGAGATWRKFFREAWQEGIKKEAPEEIVQEGFQTVSGNLISNVVYDPTRKADQNLAKALLAAGLSASLVSTGVTLLNTVKNRQQIKRAIEAEQRNGVVVSIIDENNLKILGKKVTVTPELAPLVQTYVNSRNGIAEVQNQIEALKEFARNKPISEQKKIIPQLRRLRNELNALVRRQITISKSIADTAGIAVDENAPIGESVEAAQVPESSENTNPLIFHKKLGFVQGSVDQTDVPDGSVKVEIADGAAKGQTRIVPKSEIVTDSEAVPAAQGLSFSNLTPSDGKFAVGQAVEIEGKGKGTIAEIKDNGKIIVDYNDGASRAMFNPKQLKPFVEPEPEGKLKNAQIKQNKREAAARLLGFNLQAEDVVSMPFGADGQTQTGKIVVTKKGEILFKNRILSDEDLARAVFVDRAKKDEDKQTRFTADDFGSNIEDNQVTDIESASADELIKKIRSGNSTSGNGGAIEKFTPEDAEEKQTVYTPQNKQVEITPRVVSDEDILTSFDEGYPEILQPRNRASLASDLQVMEIAKNLIPAKLSDNVNSNDGRPLAVPVNVGGKIKYALVTGNGRMLGVRLAKDKFPASYAKYAEFAKGKDASGSVNNPVYIGVVNNANLSDGDLRQLAVDSNKSNQSAMNAVETAKVDAETLDRSLMSRFYLDDSGEIESKANRGFITEFFNRNIAENERGELIDKDGVLTADGVSRIKRAIIAKAYGDAKVGMSVLSKIIESTDDVVKNITTALVRIAPRVADLKTSVENGDAFSEIEISDALATAFDKYADLKKAGADVTAFINQVNLPGAKGLSGFEKNLVQLFNHYGNAPRKLSEVLNNYLDGASAANPNQGNMFGESVSPIASDLLVAANDIFEEENNVELKKRLKLTDFGQDEPARKPDSGMEKPDPQSEGENGQPSAGSGNEAQVSTAGTQNKEQTDDIEEKPDRKFASTQLDIPEPFASEVNEFAKKLIPSSELADDGFEEDQHITAFFGLETNNPEEVKQVIGDFPPVTVKLGKIEIFDTNPDFDVVKIAVYSDELNRLNKLIGQLPNGNEYPVFKAHQTLAYVEKGEGAKYVGRDDFEGKEISFDTLIFSSKDRKKIEIPLTGKIQRYPFGYEKSEINRFPVNEGGRTFIPDAVALNVYKNYAKEYGSDQSFETIRRRGGFGINEMNRFYPDWRKESFKINEDYNAERADVKEVPTPAQNTPNDSDKLNKPESVVLTSQSNYGANNKLISQDKADKARELLRNKLHGLKPNAVLPGGIDPEVAQAGLELAVYHIEAGARKFADFAAKMMEDFGDGIKQYLPSFYMSAKYYPGLDNSEMDSEAEMNRVFAEITLPLQEKTEETQDSEEKSAENSDPKLQENIPTSDTLFDMGGRDQEGLFAIGGPAVVEEAQKGDDFKKKEIEKLKTQNTANERLKTVDAFGELIGNALFNWASSDITPETQKTAKTIISRRGDITKKGQSALDFLADVFAATYQILEAEARGMKFDEFIRQGGLFGGASLNDAQMAIYDKISSGQFSSFFNEIIDGITEETEYKNDVEYTGDNLERDLQGRNGVNDGQAIVPTESGTIDIQTRENDSSAGTQRTIESNSSGIYGSDAALSGTRSDTEIRGETTDVQTDDTGDSDLERIIRDSAVGAQSDLFGNESNVGNSENDRRLAEKQGLQSNAQTIAAIPRDLSNIRETLPFLLPEQQEDVHKAELRFEKEAGMGFTNGTGTGKTYTGLGIAKRFEKQDKKNILIVAPNDKILEDWQNSGKNLHLSTKQLKDTLDNGGSGAVVTTYANFGQNPSLVNRKWDLIIFDESHYLSQNADGDLTSAAKMMRAITLHPQGQFTYASMKLMDESAELDKLKAETEMIRSKGTEATAAERRRLDRITVEHRDKLKIYNQKLEDYRAEFKKRRDQEGQSKVVFLSATPFAYEKTIDYAEGFLFSYGPAVDSLAYNSGDARERFFMTHFGYRMRYNKLTRPDADVNTELMEQQFNSWLQKQGALSGRRLTIDADYSRTFILTESAIGRKIDEGFEYLSENYKEFPYLAEYLRKRFDYLHKRFILEAINARESIAVVRGHLALGRKVVVFHDYNKNDSFHPFLVREKTVVVYKDYQDISEEYAKFEAARPDLVKLDLSSLIAPSDLYKYEFGGDVKFFNGTIDKRERRTNVAEFNKDNSSVNILMVQSDAGREGISLHDTTGVHQRVLINLGLPVRPIAAIQTEGRIYRTNTVSDAIHLYMTTGTWFERFAFGTKISQRSSTAENLALGEEARALKNAFIQVYENAVEGYEPYDGEGKGGKDADKAAVSVISEFERAKTYYFGNGKKTSKNKAREGKDYFATPEPIGLKMVEFANQQIGESALEPSAGHGAIGRFFRVDNRKTFIEPSAELVSRLSLYSDGKIEETQFEDHHLVNKYDTIVMNPPFGSGGSQAVKHLEKAMRHLNDHGRIVALLPEGPAADKKLEKLLYESEIAEPFYKVADISLPSVTFERAGTQVRTHIVVLEKQLFKDNASGIYEKRADFSDVENINDLFDRIENLELPERLIKDRNPAYQSAIERQNEISEDGTNFDLKEFTHTKNGNTVYVAKLKERVGDFKEVANKAKSFGGYYSSFSKEGAIPGFHFKTAEARQDFVNSFETDDSMMSVFDDDGIGFSDKKIRAEQRSFARDVDVVLDGRARRDDVTSVMSEASPLLRRLGLIKAPILMPQSVVRKAVQTQTMAHNIAPEVLKQLPLELNDPVMVFDSLNDENAIVVVTNLENRNGLPLVAVIKYDGKIGRYNVNVIPSVHEKDQTRFVNDWLSKNKLRYVNNEKSQQWFRKVGLQLSETETKLLTSPIVLKNTDFVKNSDGSMLSVEDENLKREAYRIIKTVPLASLLPSAEFSRSNDRIRINIQAQEMIRRAMEQVDISRGRLDVGDNSTRASFDGLFTDPGMTKGVAKMLRDAYDAAKIGGYTKTDGIEALKDLANEIEKASEIGGKTAIFYVVDEKLPQEIFHQASYLGAIDKALSKRYANPEKMDAHPAFKTADATFFAKQRAYSVENIARQRNISLMQAASLRRAIIREETAAWIAEGSWEKLGLDYDTAMDYLLLAIESYADKNGNDSLEKFKESSKYVYEAVEKALQTERSSPERSTRKPDGKSRQGNSERKNSGGTARSSEENSSEQKTGVGPNAEIATGKEKLASLPETARIAGISVNDVTYNVFGDKAAVAAAQKLIEENGIAGTIRILNEVDNPDVHHAIASFTIQKHLLNESERIKESDPKESENLRKTALQLAANHALQAVKAGRFIRAASIIQQSVETVIAAAQRVFQNTHGKGAILPDKIFERVKAIGEQSETATAEVEAQGKIIDKLKKEIAALKKMLSGDDKFRKASKSTIAKRKKVVAQIKSAHQSEFEAAMARLKNRARIKTAPATAEMNSVFDESMYSSVEEIEIDPEELKDFAIAGAMKLSEGLATVESMFPSDFDAEMTAEFGDSIRPFLKQIHAESFKLRNKWLEEIAKKKKIAEIKREFGENLSDDEIEEILGERKEEFERRSAIEKLHKIRAKDGNLREFSRLEEIIAEIAKSDHIAAAAAMLATETPTATLFYERMKELGYEGKIGREMLRDARDTLAKAKEIYSEELKDLQSKIKEREAEVKLYEDLRNGALRRLKESQRLISKELSRISSGDFKYFLSEYVWGTINSFRGLQTAGEIGFVLRQGNWFTIVNLTKGNIQKNALKNLARGLREKSYEQTVKELESHPFYQKAIDSGVEFSALGRFDEHSLTKGEEEFRHNIFEKIPIAKQTIGTVIEKSETTMMAFLDTQRLHAFAATAEAYEAGGLSIENDPKEFRALANYINNATGRATVKNEKITNFLMNMPLFAGRFYVSRVKHLATITVGWAFLPPATRKVVLKDMGRYYVAVGALLTLAHFAGLTSLDWDDSDFLKLKFGDRRFDILGGQQQWLRFFFQTIGTASRQMLGEDYSGGLYRDNIKSEDGRINEAKHDLLSSKGFMLRFLRTKLAPVPSLGWDYLSGSDILGNEFSWSKALSSRMLPIFYQDVYGAVKQDGLLGIPMSIPGAIGVGYHNYIESPEQPGTTAEKLARKVQSMTMPDTAMEEEDKIINQRVADIRVRARAGQNVVPEITELVKTNQISTKRAQSIINGFDDSYFESKVKRLPTEVLKQIRKVANDSERALLDEMLKYREFSEKKKEINDAKRGLKAPKLDPYKQK